MATRPTVTVMLPAHNAEATLAAAIRSTLAQTYADFELWILENGSTDRTLEVARRFTDPRIRVFELGPIGFQNALQFCLDNALSPWLARLDADDLQHPHRLEAQMRVVTEHPEYVMVSSTCNWLTPFHHVFQRHFPVPSREMTLRTMLDGMYRLETGKGRISGDPMTMFSRKVALEVGGYDREFTMGDVPLWLRMLEGGNRGWEQVEPLYLYRLSPSSASQNPTVADEAWNARRKYDPLPPPPPSANAKSPTPAGRHVGFWLRIARLEMLAGNSEGVRRIAADLDRDGHRRHARRLRMLVSLGGLGTRILTKRLMRRDPFTYHHRPDWEGLFAPMMADGNIPPPRIDGVRVKPDTSFLSIAEESRAVK